MTLGPIPGSWADRINRVEARKGWAKGGGSAPFSFETVFSVIVGATLVGVVLSQFSGIDPAVGNSL